MASTSLNLLSSYTRLKSCRLNRVTLLFLMIAVSRAASATVMPLNILIHTTIAKQLLPSLVGAQEQQFEYGDSIPGLIQFGNNFGKAKAGRDAGHSEATTGGLKRADKVKRTVDQNQSDEIDLERSFEKLLERFKAALEGARKKNILAIWQTDLDHTLVQMVVPFPQGPVQSILQTERERMMSFQVLKDQFKDVFVLVYNTARATVEDSLRHTSPNSLLDIRKVSTKLLDNSFDPDVKGLLFHDLESQKRFLPIPDVLILGQGKKIEVASNFAQASSIRSSIDISFINQSIRSWLEEDSGSLQTISTELSRQRIRSIISVSGTSLDIPRQDPLIDWQRLNQFFRNFGSDLNTTFAPALRLRPVMSTVLKRCHGALVSVNKGTASRVAMEKVIVGPLEKKPDQVMVYTSGDELADLPMLVPTLESAAHGEVTDQAIAVRDHRLQQLGVPPLNGDAVDKWWAKSMIPEEAVFGNPYCCGDYVQQTLRNPKVTYTRGWGIMQYVEVITSHLEEVLAQASDRPDDIH